MGLTFAPLGALSAAELFPAELRYAGASSAYNLGGILGRFARPDDRPIAAGARRIAFVGGYIVVAAGVSFLSLITIKGPHLRAGRTSRS